MEVHKQKRGQINVGVMGGSGPLDAVSKALHETEFLGYETIEAEAELKFIIAQKHLCDHFKEIGHEKEVTLILDRSPFYGAERCVSPLVHRSVIEAEIETN